jgi:DNA-binding NarL/FixJ family response regulator
MSIDISRTTGSHGTLATRTVRTVARVDLRPAAAGRDRCQPRLTGSHGSFSSALLTIEQTVRPDDRVCPFGVAHIAVAFGPDADAVHPKVLGERLARAVGQGLLAGPPDRGNDLPGTGRAANVSPATTGVAPSTTVVTVDRLVGNSDPGGWTETRSDSDPSSHRIVAPKATAPFLSHRTIVRYSTGRLAGYGTRHDDRPLSSHPEGSLGTMLVIDPDPRAGGSPGMAAQATCTLARGLGFKAGVVALCAGDQLIADIDGVNLDLVVLVVGAEPAGRTSSWSSSTWCVPAQLTEQYRSIGTTVLAVSSGATAGALVGSIQQGASVLFDLNALSTELLAFSRSDPSALRCPSDLQDFTLPPSLGALLSLTSSERRVLFYLTTGLAAQDIADELVVSLTTVRSHIRSILRKLDVRSQLAAVAMANSCGAFHETSHAS